MDMTLNFPKLEKDFDEIKHFQQVADILREEKGWTSFVITGTRKDAE